MQAVLVLLAVAGSTAWLAMDASKRDWSNSSFAKSTGTLVIRSVLIWPVVLVMYVFKHRKIVPLLATAAPQPRPAAPAMATEAARPSEQYGPSLDEIEREPVVDVHPEPIVESEPEPVVDVAPEPVAAIEPEPEPVIDVAPQPEPIVEIEVEPVVDVAPQPEPIVEPEPVMDTASEPILAISHPEPLVPAAEAPPGLSVDAFKDIKPVAFGGFVSDYADEAPATAEVAPEPTVEAQPEPAPAESAPEPVIDVHPEPVVEIEIEPEPVVEPEPEPVLYPDLDVEPVAEPEPVAVEPEPKPRKRGLRLPNPEIKLPSLGGKLKLPTFSLTRKPKAAAAAPAGSADAAPAAKKSFLTLPANLQGPLDDLERKIVLGSIVAVLAAAALGYKTAPSADVAAPSPGPTPAAASR